MPTLVLAAAAEDGPNLLVRAIPVLVITALVVLVVVLRRRRDDAS